MTKNNSDFAENIPPRSTFPPTIRQVADYCRERGNSVDPRAFVDWCIWGLKGGLGPMKDWKAMVRSWERKDTNRQNAAVNSIRETLSNHAAWDAWKDMPDSAEKYQAYLCSPDWGRRRAAVSKRSGGTCERCRINPAAAVHHLTYAHKYDEPLEDLIHECQGCHDYTHGHRDDDPILEAVKMAEPIRLGVLLVDSMKDWGEDLSTLLCPVCRDDSVHIGKPEYGYGKVSEGIVIPCWCESGHAWKLFFSQRDGHTFAFTQCFGMKKEYQDVDIQERPAVSEGTTPMGLLEDDHAGPIDEDAAPRDGLTSQFYGSENLDDV